MTAERHRLHIPGSDLSRIRKHAEAQYPEECCGILVGRIAEQDAVVERVVPTPNGHARRSARFEIPPEKLLEAMVSARAMGSEIVGFYHSHPDADAQPSSADRDAGWPGVSYLIIEVESGVARRSRSWRIGEEGVFAEERIVDASGGTGSMPADWRFE